MAITQEGGSLEPTLHSRRNFLRIAGLGAGATVAAATGLAVDKKFKSQPEIPNNADVHNPGLAPVPDNPTIITSEPTASVLKPTEFLFQLGNEFSIENATLVKEELEYADRYYQEMSGITLDGPVIIEISRQIDSGLTSGIEKGVRHIKINPDKFIGSVPEKRKAVAHELFHQYQYELGGYPPSKFKYPTWLFEGSAEYAGYLAVVYQGLISEEEIRKSRKHSIIDNKSRLIELARLNSYNIGDNNNTGYSEAYLAVDRLAGDGGLQKIFNFYKTVSKDRDKNFWPAHFISNFGIDTETFERKFDEELKNISLF